MTSRPVTIREATPDDLDVVMRHRRSMFADRGIAGGGPLYESLGFTPTNEMRLHL